MLKVTTAKYYIPSGRCIQAINYAERNEDGSVKRIPDSLKHAFKTADGRKVWDGGGIDPDLPIAKPTPNPLIEALLSKNVIFDFATKYKISHASIAPAVDFKLSDQDYADFLAFVKNRDYSYKTESDKLLEKLKEAATEEKYYDAVKSQYEDIKKKLEADKANAIDKNKKEIVTLIENEICGRYYYLNGKIEKSLQNDALAIKAIELLNNPQGEYKDLLTAKK
jgi:carboxyl-terminal processing protease